MRGSLRKLKRAGGFTLSETLIAVLILLMVSAVVAAGIPMAADVYEKVVDGSNAQVLLSTTVTALRDELAIASDLSVDSSEKSVTYKAANGAMSKLSPAEGGILLQEYLDVTDPGVTAPSRKLVSQKAASDRLYALWEGISYENGIVTVTGLKVKKTGGDGKDLASLSTLKIRVLMND